MSITKSEDLTVQVDGIANVFTVAEGPFIVTTLKVYHNGLLLRRGTDLDYVENAGANSFTMDFVPEVGDTLQVEYEVFPSASIATGYASVQDIRDAGVPEPPAIGGKTDEQIQELIAIASQQIDRFTGRWFEPRDLTLRLDGTGRPGLLFGPPIISIDSIKLISDDFLTASTLAIDLNDVRIYNRHLAGLFDPDDRENPRIEWITYDVRHERLPFGHTLDDSVFHPNRWPEGTQNVEVIGKFGYTEPDGGTTPEGITPPLIRRATIMMVMRDLEDLGSSDRFDARNAWRLTELKTRDQTIKWGDPSRMGARGVGYFTGDPEIDSIIAQFVRPPAMGAA